MHRIRKSSLSGMSLIEVVAVIAVETVLLASAVGLIGRLLEAENSGRRELQTEMSAAALATQFRRDVNAAEQFSISLQKASSVIELELTPDTVAAYEIAAGHVQRIQRHEAKIVRREAYRLPRESTVSVQELAEGQRRMLRMTILFTSNEPSLVCDAVLARDRVASTPAEGSQP
jgi:hypothetical protein